MGARRVRAAHDGPFPPRARLWAVRRAFGLYAARRRLDG